MDDLIERLEAKTPEFMNGAIKCGGKVINPDGPEAAAEIRALRAARDDWKRLHAENCAVFDNVCAEREWLRDRAVDRAALEEPSQ